MITVDSRDATHHPDIVVELRRKLGYSEVDTSKMLDFADYCFAAPHPTEFDRSFMVGIEICTPSDLCGKLNSGRLAFQLSGMIERYDYPILLIEAPLTANREGYVSIPGAMLARTQYDRLMDALAAAQAHGVRLIIGRSRDTTAHHILQQYEYWRKPDHKTFRQNNTVTPEILIPLSPALEKPVTMLMQVPGVGALWRGAVIGHA